MKNVVIIGANSNIGSGLAKHFWDKKELVHLFYHKHKNHIADLEDKERICLYQADIIDFESIKGITDSFKFTPDILVICSSQRSIDHKPIAEIDLLQSQEIIQVNFIGIINVLKAFIPLMRSNRPKHIISFGSNVTRIGLPNGSVYSATKAACSNLVRSVSMEEATNNLFINTISPGPVEIDDSHFPQDYIKFREIYYQNKIKNIPLKRLAQIEEIIHLTDFLTSDQNTYITGEEIFLTGGSL